MILAGMLLSGCAAHREIDQTVNRIFDPVMEINLVAIHFFEQEGRWPHSREEFSDFADEQKLPFTRDGYRNLTFESQDDGSLWVSYRQVSPHQGEIQMTLGPPEKHTPR